MHTKHEEIFNIRSYEVDFNNQLFISSIFDYMQQSATLHANNLGFGFDDLAKKGLYWVLSRIDVEIMSLPTYGGKVTVTTWPKSINKLFAMRDYILRDDHGNIICKATSAWILMDINKKRPSRPPKDLYDQVEEYAINTMPDKIQEPVNRILDYEHIVGYSDCDINKHVNNVNYIRWVQNTFDQTFHNTHRMTHIQVNFLCECGMGDAIEIYKQALENDQWYIDGHNKTLGQKAFQAIMTWEQI
ncbi:acyl-[acyl-carrier-protein] thioesterase [Vallitalea okinawensis]|uniref:acyl-[acyl-carrier-protein] thioesterase n=1 Tax=Vallitalea okinawensis TaxID=2078660 RepID=UPI0013001B81|nr:acyl-ACP thioesterase domain-containing protein [Vallitalea okinawensis]